MRVTLFNKRHLFLPVLLFSMGVQAQTYRFIYIQTENKQPFYVKMDKRTLNSSLSGYMIIARLADSTYSLTIGFPKNEWPEYNVKLNTNEKNVGYLLKKSGVHDWDLYNLETLKPLILQKLEPVIKKDSLVVIDNEFARILAEVVNDPSIAQIVVSKESKSLANTGEDNGSIIPVVQSVTLPPVKKIIADENKTDKSEIKKLNQESSAEGVHITYVDIAKVKTDTVKIFMPVKKDEAIVVKEKESKIADPAAKNVEADKMRMINSDCKSIASQDDFLQLQKKMAAENNDKTSLKIANKQLLKTCFSCEQIKSLGDLFNRDEERYKFFVAAYPFVSDTHNFGVLEDKLTDDYYKTRFKAMLGQK